MNKLLVFEIGGHFAHFNDPLTSPKYLKRTFNIIPKPTLFGLLGAIIGLKGYSYSYEKLPEFYEVFKDKKVFIVPISFPFNKQVVKYNSLNSFANNDSKNPNVIMQEEILINPEFRIGVLVNTEEPRDKKLIENIKNKKSFYHIYLGKNEFFSTLKFVGLYSYKDEITKEAAIDSIFPLEFLEEKVSLVDNIVIDRMITGFAFDELNNMFRPLATKVCFIRDNEKVTIKDQYIDYFKTIETGETICLF